MTSKKYLFVTFDVLHERKIIRKITNPFYACVAKDIII